MTAIRTTLCLLVLVPALGACASGPRQTPSAELGQSLRMCKQRAWGSCAGLWECERRVRKTCLQEQGWKFVDGQWLRGKDWSRGQEIDAQLESAG